MTYLEEILHRQKMLALRADGEAAELPKLGVAAFSEESAENASEAAAEGKPRPEQEGQTLLLNGFRELSESALRLAAIRQQARAALQTVQPEPETVRQLRQPDGMSGGLVTRSVSLLQTTGAAGYDTRRSMAEISRFFERDARRYGGF